MAMSDKAIFWEGGPMLHMHEPKPARGFPPGRVRWIMRPNEWVKAAVRTADGIRIYIVKDAGDAWEPMLDCEQASKRTAVLWRAGAGVVCNVCGTVGCIENRGPDFHTGDAFGSLVCDYSGTPPFADAEWAGANQDPECLMCEWCGGTGHPHGDESYGYCKCPDLPRDEEEAR
jgi:hypothetical protein